MPVLFVGSTVKFKGCPSLLICESRSNISLSSCTENLLLPDFVINNAVFLLPLCIGLCNTEASCINASVNIAANAFCICGSTPGNCKIILGFTLPSQVPPDVVISCAIPRSRKNFIFP